MQTHRHKGVVRPRPEEVYSKVKCTVAWGDQDWTENPGPLQLEPAERSCDLSLLKSLRTVGPGSEFSWVLSSLSFKGKDPMQGRFYGKCLTIRPQPYQGERWENRQEEFGIKEIHTAMFKWITNKDLLYSTMLRGILDGEWSSRECICANVPIESLLFTWNYYNTVNWLYLNIK